MINCKINNMIKLQVRKMGRLDTETQLGKGSRGVKK